MIKKLLKLWNCYILGNHTWTSKAMENIPPVIKEGTTAKEGIAAFKEYAKMYCKHCGKESKLNEQLK